MTVDKIVEFSYSHFWDSQFTQSDLRKILKRHAIEAHDLSEREAERFMLSFDYGEMKKIEGMQDFFLWYYFNYVGCPRIDTIVLDPFINVPPAENASRVVMVYAIVKVTALIENLSEDDSMPAPGSAYRHEFSRRQRGSVVAAEFVGTTLDMPAV